MQVSACCFWKNTGLSVSRYTPTSPSFNFYSIGFCVQALWWSSQRSTSTEANVWLDAINKTIVWDGPPSRPAQLVLALCDESPWSRHALEEEKHSISHQLIFFGSILVYACGLLFFLFFFQLFTSHLQGSGLVSWKPNEWKDMKKVKWIKNFRYSMQYQESICYLFTVWYGSVKVTQ